MKWYAIAHGWLSSLETTMTEITIIVSILRPTIRQEKSYNRNISRKQSARQDRCRHPSLNVSLAYGCGMNSSEAEINMDIENSGVQISARSHRINMLRLRKLSNLERKHPLVFADSSLHSVRLRWRRTRFSIHSAPREATETIFRLS